MEIVQAYLSVYAIREVVNTQSFVLGLDVILFTIATIFETWTIMTYQYFAKSNILVSM